MISILFSWIGATDLRAQKEEEQVGVGPIAQAVLAYQYDEIVLVSDYKEDLTTPYTQWLHKKGSSKVSIRHVNLTSPTNFGEIYSAATKIVTDKLSEYSHDIKITFHLSPGTPAMAAVWIILGKTRFPAELIESSREKGACVASVPFNISAEYIPDLLRKPDSDVAKLAIGLPAEAPEFDDIIHQSEVMERVILKARRVAPHFIPVLIEGESGTGKELLARAIHKSSNRNNKPFIAINCGAIPKELFESELFGHEKGAFTGAFKERIGHFEAAHEGTLFFDEIGELPKEIQVKLLRTLQEGEVQRLGSNKAKQIDVRIIAATNKNLIQEISKGSFREDLFYRLAVAVIKIPPLREREGDIGLLMDKLLEVINEQTTRKLGLRDKIISVSARNLLIQYIWPGNVRELINTLTRASVWSAGDIIDAKDISDAIIDITSTSLGKKDILSHSLNQGVDLPGLMKIVAVHYMRRGLALTHGNKTKAAQILGLPNYQTLTNWLKKYGLE